MPMILKERLLRELELNLQKAMDLCKALQGTKVLLAITPAAESRKWVQAVAQEYRGHRLGILTSNQLR